jgi:hypothetical protein
VPPRKIPSQGLAARWWRAPQAPEHARSVTGGGGGAERSFHRQRARLRRQLDLTCGESDPSLCRDKVVAAYRGDQAVLAECQTGTQQQHCRRPRARHALHERSRQTRASCTARRRGSAAGTARPNERHQIRARYSKHRAARTLGHKQARPATTMAPGRPYLGDTMTPRINISRTGFKAALQGGTQRTEAPPTRDAGRHRLPAAVRRHRRRRAGLHGLAGRPRADRRLGRPHLR